MNELVVQSFHEELEKIAAVSEMLGRAARKATSAVAGAGKRIGSAPSRFMKAYKGAKFPGKSGMPMGAKFPGMRGGPTGKKFPGGREAFAQRAARSAGERASRTEALKGLKVRRQLGGGPSQYTDFSRKIPRGTASRALAASKIRMSGSAGRATGASRGSEAVKAYFKAKGGATPGKPGMASQMLKGKMKARAAVRQANIKGGKAKQMFRRMFGGS